MRTHTPDPDLILVPESADPDLEWAYAPGPCTCGGDCPDCAPDVAAHLVTFPDRPPMIMVVVGPGTIMLLPL